MTEDRSQKNSFQERLPVPCSRRSELLVEILKLVDPSLAKTINNEKLSMKVASESSIEIQCEPIFPDSGEIGVIL